MKSHRLLIAVASSVALAAPLSAQSGGNVELGGFGQFTRVDDAWHTKNGFGGGGRLGVFLTNRWELEGTAAFASFDNTAPRAAGSSTYQTFTGQINYGIPFGLGGHTHQLLLEAGAGGQRFAGHNDFTVPLGGGFRFMLGDQVALRIDGIVQWVENPTAPGFGFTGQVGTNNSAAARSSNFDLRAGLSWIFGNKHEPPPPPPPRQITQAPPPRSEPQPPPARVEPAPPPAPNRDSIDAVNRARAALVAKVFFDFDKSDLRDDQRAVLDAKLPVMRANPGVRIRIEGNADERGSDEYNQALGMRRAQIARKYLIDHGIDAGRIDIVSYGEEKPVCQEHEESCWSQNRRDEFVIVAGEITRG